MSVLSEREKEVVVTLADMEVIVDSIARMNKAFTAAIVSINDRVTIIEDLLVSSGIGHRLNAKGDVAK